MAAEGFVAVSHTNCFRVALINTSRLTLEIPVCQESIKIQFGRSKRV